MIRNTKTNLITFEGCVISTTAPAERPVRIMSDVWGTEYYRVIKVWDNSLYAVSTFTIATDSPSDFEVTVDITAKNAISANAWQFAEDGRKLIAEATAVRERNEAIAKKPGRDKRVEVIGGQKWPGVIGRIFWTGEDKFRPGSLNVGIIVDDCPELRSGCLPEKVFVTESYCKVLNWEQYLPGAKLLVIKKTIVLKKA